MAKFLYLWILQLALKLYLTMHTPHGGRGLDYDPGGKNNPNALSTSFKRHLKEGCVHGQLPSHVNPM